MKKLIAIMIILFIIFISMLIYRNNEKEAEVKIDEIKQIESYIEKIYGWREVTDEALPTFQDINNANENWLWGTVRENIEDYEIDYEKIENTGKELFGEKFTKEYPKEGNKFITYNQENGKYQLKEIMLDAIKDSFLIEKIEKKENEYTVEIIEYLIDYTNADNNRVTINNLKDEKIFELVEEEATETNIKKLIKESKEKFSKKRIILEKNDNNIFIKSVE